MNNINDRQTLINIDEQVKNNKNSIKEIKQAINNLDMLFKQKMHWIRDEINMLKGKSRREKWEELKTIRNKFGVEIFDEEGFMQTYYYIYLESAKYDPAVKRIFDLIKDGKAHKIEQELKASIENLRYENKRYRRLLSVRIELLLNSLFRALKGYFTRRQ